MPISQNQIPNMLGIQTADPQQSYTTAMQDLQESIENQKRAELLKNYWDSQAQFQKGIANTVQTATTPTPTYSEIASGVKPVNMSGNIGSSFAPDEMQSRNRAQQIQNVLAAYQAPIQQRAMLAKYQQQQQQDINKKNLELLGEEKKAEFTSKLRSPQLLTEGTSELRKEMNPKAVRMKDIEANYGKITGSAKMDTPAGDISMVYSYMKMVDPGSTVREGEFATAQNAAGIPDRIRNIYNKAASGERLTPSQRIDFVKASGDMYEKEKDVYMQEVKSYEDLAGRHGYDPKDIILFRPSYDIKKETEAVVSSNKEKRPVSFWDKIKGVSTANAEQMKTIRIPKSDTQSIRDARQDGFNVEVY